ncbi:MAG: HPF/RaiA family ribosome-associated protein [Gemmatimonadota bacterium]|nr:MAG: HPF/RaiA family ribosome-associated protein [Gemmatimonadota bacterium]
MFSELTFKHVDSTDEIRQRFDREVKKLKRRLNHFPEDGVQLSGVIEARIGKELKSCTLTLRLPRKTLHTTNEGYKILESLDTAFDDITTQFEKYRTQLRREQFWKKGRAQTIKTPPEPAPEEEMEFEEEFNVT